MQATIHIKGHVQGVFFRANAKEEADKRGLFGWIKNMDDGSVSACVQGPEADVRAFIDWCSHGPGTAKVDSVEVEEEKNPQNIFQEFTILGS